VGQKSEKTKLHDELSGFSWSFVRHYLIRHQASPTGIASKNSKNSEHKELEGTKA
jgi:hypothetical protein